MGYSTGHVIPTAQVAMPERRMPEQEVGEECV